MFQPKHETECVDGGSDPRRQGLTEEAPRGQQIAADRIAGTGPVEVSQEPRPVQGGGLRQGAQLCELK